MADVVFWNASEQFDTRDHFSVRRRTTGVYVMKKWLEISGYTAEVIDFSNFMNTDDLVQITLNRMSSDTLCIGVNMTFMGYGNTSNWLTMAYSEIKLKYPNVKLCVGGHNPFFPQIYPKFNPDPDITYLEGHGEELMITYLDELSGRRVTRQNFDIQTKLSSYPDNFEAFPGEVMDLEISRGCQFKCRFCRYPLLGKTKGSYIRHKEYIIQELMENYERFGTTRYRITCDTYNEDNDKVTMMRDVQREVPFNLEYVCFARLDLLQRNPDQLDQMYESGLRAVFFGIETINLKSARSIGKGWHGTLQGQEYFRNINQEFRENGVRLTAGLISGLPGDTPESLRSDVQWFSDNRLQSGTYTALSIVDSSRDNYPFPSEFDRESEKFGYYFENTGSSMYDASEWTRRSDGLTYSYFKEFTMELNYHLYSKGYNDRKLACWKLFDYASVMNVSIDDAININEIDIEGSPVIEKMGSVMNNSEQALWQDVLDKARSDVWNYTERMLK